MSRTDHHVPRKFLDPRDDKRTGVARYVSRDGLAEYCTMLERRARAELRAHIVLVIQARRAGGDPESVLEPDARPRHRGHWDFL